MRAVAFGGTFDWWDLRVCHEFHGLLLIAVVYDSVITLKSTRLCGPPVFRGYVGVVLVKPV